MNIQPYKKPLIIGLIVIGIVLLGVATVAKLRSPKGLSVEKGGGRSLEETVIYSNITKSTQGFTVNYGADSNPNYDAVRHPYKIFSMDTLGLPDSVTGILEDTLSDQLNRQVTPTYPLAFIQIEKSSIKCAGLEECRFSFYIDSPEMYFDFSMINRGDTAIFSLNQTVKRN